MSRISGKGVSEVHPIEGLVPQVTIEQDQIHPNDLIINGIVITNQSLPDLLLRPQNHLRHIRCPRRWSKVVPICHDPILDPRKLIDMLQMYRVFFHGQADQLLLPDTLRIIANSTSNTVTR